MIDTIRPKKTHYLAFTRKVMILSGLLCFCFEPIVIAAPVPPNKPSIDQSLKTPAFTAEETRVARRAKRRRPPRKSRRSEPAPQASEKPQESEASAPSETTDTAEPTPAPAATGADEGAALQRGSRVEFDGRLVQGQTAKSGAIYLFGRKRSELKTMVREREHYRKELLRTVFRAQ